jgi:uncharacterized protein
MASSIATSASAAENLRRDLPPWKLRDVLVGILFTQIPVMAVLIGLQLLPQSSTSSTSTHPVTQTAIIVTAIILGVIEGVGEGVFLISPLYYARKRGRQAGSVSIGYRALGFRSFNPLGAVGWIIVGFAVTIVAANAYIYVLQHFFHTTPQTNVQQLADQKPAQPILLATAIVAVFIAPIAEELFFRGFMMEGFRKIMPAGFAIFLSGILFGVAHVQPQSLVLLIVAGWWLGFMRVRTRSIWPGVFFHMLNNAVSFIGILALPHMTF